VEAGREHIIVEHERVENIALDSSSFRVIFKNPRALDHAFVLY